MTRIKQVYIALIGLVCVPGGLPAAAHAQSAIGGTVKDTSGAVLPGVTVEVSSDVLIEKTRSVSTDAQGEYKIVDLRPGVYVISFSLQGFSTFKREALELPSNFTATINAEMKVGALEESVTVSGSSPVVDVQSNQKTQVLSRDVLDAVPSAKTIQGLGQLVVGDHAVVAGRRRLARHAAGVLRRTRRRRVRRHRHRGRAADQRQHGRRRGDGVSQRSDDPGSRVSDGRRYRRNGDGRDHDEPGAERRRQPLRRRA